MFEEFIHNVQKNLFQPLLLFFYAGFLVPIFRVAFEFPHAIYQGLTIYLLIAIGWHGGEELASLKAAELNHALGFMVIGFITNTIIGLAAYALLRGMTHLRKIDAATVAGYYGSDSAGTFVTCVGVLTAANIAFAPYMPVLLAVMEVPGCLVALYMVSRLRLQGMDKNGNLPSEPGYMRQGAIPDAKEKEELEVAAMMTEDLHGHHHSSAVSVQPNGHSTNKWKLLHEVFLNPGLFLLFAGIVMGFVSRWQGADTNSQDELFYHLFKGFLCLFLLEMGVTASKRIRDLKTAGIGFIAFGLIAPNIFATTGIMVAHTYSHVIGVHFELGTYVLFAVLCGAASYIAVPAVQRMAIPEASPTLPLAASLGLTFSYNVTIGIPVYIMIAQALTSMWPVTG